MKKITGMLLVMVMLGSLLAGCYSKSCDQPQSMSSPYKK